VFVGVGFFAADVVYEEKEGQCVEGPSSKTKKAQKKKLTKNEEKERFALDVLCYKYIRSLSLAPLSALTSNKKKSKLT
jgi:hypothetical protein